MSQSQEIPSSAGALTQARNVVTVLGLVGGLMYSALESESKQAVTIADVGNVISQTIEQVVTNALDDGALEQNLQEILWRHSESQVSLPLNLEVYIWRRHATPKRRKQ